MEIFLELSGKEVVNPKQFGKSIKEREVI